MEAAHAIDVRPYLAELPKDKVLCFFGTDEIADKSTACQVPELDGATRVERPGGHHFDGNYQIIADKILERLKAR
jgi:type IV secretory pathway VirJ component